MPKINVMVWTPLRPIKTWSFWWESSLNLLYLYLFSNHDFSLELYINVDACVESFNYQCRYYIHLHECNVSIFTNHLAPSAICAHAWYVKYCVMSLPLSLRWIQIDMFGIQFEYAKCVNASFCWEIWFGFFIALYHI